jgi:hypothetical protein
MTTQNETPGANIGGTASMAWCAWPTGTAFPLNGSYSMNGWLFSYDTTIPVVSTWLSPPFGCYKQSTIYVFETNRGSKALPDALF